jgi:hypothetical protein
VHFRYNNCNIHKVLSTKIAYLKYSLFALDEAADLGGNEGADVGGNEKASWNGTTVKFVSLYLTLQL